MIFKNFKIIVIFYCRFTQKKNRKTISKPCNIYVEYISKQKGGKRRFQKNIEAFLEGGKSTLEVAKTLDKIGFFKEKTEEEKKIKTKPGKIGRGRI